MFDFFKKNKKPNPDASRLLASILAVYPAVQSVSYDAKDGTKRYVTEVIVDEAHFVESKSSKNSTPSNNYGSDPGAPATTVLNDDPEVLSDDGVPF